MKTIRAGCIVKTVLYTAPEPRDTKPVRAIKSRMTSAAQKALNDKSARVRLEMLVWENFGPEDLFVTLTYRDEDLPRTWKEAVLCVRKFLRNFRNYRGRRGQPLKYIYTTEGKHGDHRLHHHLIINATERDVEAIRSLWAYGDIVDLEYVGERGHTTLALYMTKESMEGRPVGAQMWTSSRNLRKPEVESKLVHNDAELTVPAGCFVLEKEEKVTEFGSYCYIKYRVPRSMGRRREQEPAGRPRPPYLVYNKIYL